MNNWKKSKVLFVPRPILYIATVIFISLNSKCNKIPNLPFLAKKIGFFLLHFVVQSKVKSSWNKCIGLNTKTIKLILLIMYRCLYNLVLLSPILTIKWDLSMKMKFNFAIYVNKNISKKVGINTIIRIKQINNIRSEILVEMG